MLIKIVFYTLTDTHILSFYCLHMNQYLRKLNKQYNCMCSLITLTLDLNHRTQGQQGSSKHNTFVVLLSLHCKQPMYLVWSELLGEGECKRGYLVRRGHNASCRDFATWSWRVPQYPRCSFTVRFHYVLQVKHILVVRLEHCQFFAPSHPPHHHYHAK
jgi:hypothetical protein